MTICAAEHKQRVCGDVIEYNYRQVWLVNSFVVMNSFYQCLAYFHALVPYIAYEFENGGYSEMCAFVTFVSKLANLTIIIYFHCFSCSCTVYHIMITMWGDEVHQS